MERSSLISASARHQLMEDRMLGAGSFLDRALEVNQNRDVPFIYRHHTDQHGSVVLTSYSLLELRDLRDDYARWYHANGVKVGDPVGVYVAEGLEPLLHNLALVALGAVAVLVNDAMPLSAARRYFSHVGVVGVVCDDPTALIAAYRQDARGRPAFLAGVSELRAFEAARAALPPGYPYRHADEDIVAVVHSSGTTGLPKPTMLGHRQFWVGKEPRMVRFPSAPGDRMLSIMPHTHIGGLSYFMTAVLLGLPFLAMSGWRRAEVEPVMQEFQPTLVGAFPRAFVELATGEAPTTACAQVHTWFSTGDAAHYGHIRKLVQLGRRPAGTSGPWLVADGSRLQTALPGSQFLDGLGSSEIGMALFGHAITPEELRRDRCIGKALPIVERAAVLDADGRELPVGEAGLLAVRTPTRTAGYWNDAALTKRFELAGYWLTGDIVRQDEDGRFYHLDRSVDVIDTAAGPVYSLPLEEVLIADCADTILDCTVIGVPAADPSWHAAIAIVRLQPTVAVSDTSSLLAQVNEHLDRAGLTRLAALMIAHTADDLPTGATGKILKRELRTRWSTLFAAPQRQHVAQHI